MVIVISLGLPNEKNPHLTNGWGIACPFSNMIYSNVHMLPTVCTSMLNAYGQLYVYILCVFLLTVPVNTIQFMLPMAIGIYINYRY